MNTEQNWDKLLQIKTADWDEKKADNYRFRYEPTPYSVLSRLKESGLFGRGDVLLDYGCGKGRVGFFLSHETGVKCIGIDYDETVYGAALKNRETALSGDWNEFVLAGAEGYTVPAEVNRCYFFNPFSVEILHKVMARILESYYGSPREMLLFFYFPSEEYIAYLMTVDELVFYDEIECEDLFEGNNRRERVMVFKLPGFSY